MRNDLRVIDSDGHVMESGEELARFGFAGSTGLDTLDRMLNRSSSSVANAVAPGTQPFTAASRLDDMDREEIAVSINYPTGCLMINQLEAQVGNDLAGAYNSWAYETFTVPTDGRVLTMALVNVADPAGAAVEARRALAELGAPGIIVSPFAGYLHLDDPSLDDLWAVAEEFDVAVGVHGGRYTTDPLLPATSFRDRKRYYVMAHPFGQMVALGDMVSGGVLERFPRLRVVFLEAGIGWVRWYADRLDESEESGNEPSAHLEREPSEYVYGGNCFFSCEPDEPGLVDMIRAIGDDLVVFASDYPHFDCSFPNSVVDFRQHLSDDNLFDKVTVDNAKRLYGPAIKERRVAPGGRTSSSSGPEPRDGSSARVR